MLSGFSVENYKAFADEQRIKLKPLTLFFGWNSGGKSSLLRFLPLISESLTNRSRPIRMGGKVGRRSTWPALVCRATESDLLKFSFEWEQDTHIKAEWAIAGDLNGAWQEVRAFTLDGQSGSSQLSKFDGLIPPGELDGMTTGDLRKMLLRLPHEVQWLQGLRKKPERLTQYGGDPAELIQPDGEDAVDHLVDAYVNKNEAVTEEVQKFFRALDEELSLGNPANGVWQVLLCPRNKPSTRIDLCDTGEGYSQVLPVLVALARAMHGGPRILCLEQPELHLHTRAQAQLAHQLVAAATSDASPRILVETHSEVLLSSIQLAIAQGLISSESVQIYWVESRDDGTGAAMPVNLNNNGEPDNSILAGAFGEALHIGQKLVEAQLKNAGLLRDITGRPAEKGEA